MKRSKERAISWKQILLIIVIVLSFNVGGPLLLMELAFLLRGVGAEVCWITNQRPSETNNVVYSLEHKMLHRGVQVVLSNNSSSLSYYTFPYLHNLFFPSSECLFCSFIIVFLGSHSPIFLRKTKSVSTIGSSFFFFCYFPVIYSIFRYLSDATF